MANGTVVPGAARWTGRISVEGVEVEGEFEVFDSGGSWKFLFGKPLLERFSAVHDYRKESIMLHGKRGAWREVFNGGMGTVVAPQPIPRLENRSQRNIPRPAAQTHAVLDESEGPAGGVTVKALTPLDREVDDLRRNKQNHVTNDIGQYEPKAEPPGRRCTAWIEEAPDEEVTQASVGPCISGDTMECGTNEDQEADRWVTEGELEEWLREDRRMRREETIKWQEELELRQRERRKLWEKEEEQRDAEWAAWLKRQRAEPGLRRWFFWRNRFKTLDPPRRLRVESLGGDNAPPSREVSADMSPTSEHSVNRISAETHSHRGSSLKVSTRAEEEAGAESDAEVMPNGSRADSVGGFDMPPSREVSNEDLPVNPQNADQAQTAPVCVLLADEEYPNQSDMGVDFFPDALDQSDNANLFTRNDGEAGAFRPERVKEILRKVRIGENLSADQRTRVEQLLSEYADCFALSVGEVRPVKGAVHRLNIPEGSTFPKKVRQKSLTPPQREYLHAKVDELLEAGVIERCNPEDVKCVSPLTLAQKAHEGTGLTVEELMHKLNDECMAAGLPASFDLPTRPVPQPPEPTERAGPPKPAKWRICQNFMAVNKLTEIAPMPQGNIRSKQQSLSGHTYICLFDFASGFYACEVAKESRPYTAFYVEGKGYFWCAKLPFGLTGAPSTFANMTALHLDDLIADGTIELFVDDGGSADDDFDTMFTKLQRILDRVRSRDLSLSAAKSEFFMSEGIFAGGKISKEGVTVDPAKLTAIVEWKQPEDALNLASFVGLTGHFRDLIRNYARIEGPLRNLLKSVPLPQNYTKSTYRKAMESFKLAHRWTLDHTKAFLALKKALVSEPVLKAPRWDGSSFIVTTDGCKEGFAAVVAQRFEVVHPNGTTTYKTHPVGFASKRTSTSEQNYKPFLLEFAALKFGLDKFSDMIWGFPIEIETDCQALRDVLANDKLNAAHSRWRDGVLAHHIVDVRHIPGKLNVVADGLSRMWEGQDRVMGDGSEWTVSEDWEAVTGLVNDVFGVSIAEGMMEEGEVTNWEALSGRFRGEPVFMEVIDALRVLESPADDKAKQRARHKAARYMVDGSRLWKVGGNGGIRERARVECITRREAVELAREEYQQED
ncbi:Retrovirus-related Pol polyprotein from transposon opus Includes: ame: Full=Protease [Lentinula edodes]|uniref:Protease n=1 Tax=Lentinula edodes TaxID=5353 RepID=A0A1Q3E745_LENED|nr:Retrovirus-related Pol polyprotein from transposon opus Includes: ame: Full=Protease [Lentinula edodes]